jgi:hypothetical protein
MTYHEIVEKLGSKIKGAMGEQLATSKSIGNIKSLSNIPA